METLEQLADVCTEQDCKAGEVLIQQGKRGGHLYIARSGQYRVYVTEEGIQRELAVLGRGSVFGEIGVVSGVVATASVEAITDGQLLVMNENDFHHVMYHSPMLAESVLRAMQRYL